MEVIAKIHRIPDVTGSNAVLLEGDDLALVDTGIKGNSENILRYIEALGRHPHELKYIVLSHFHFDHSGSAMELKDHTGAQIVAHHAETERVPGTAGKLWLRKGNEADSNQPPAWYRWWRAGTGMAGGGGGRRGLHTADQETVIDVTVQEGDVLPVLGGGRILHTPGHTPGSICVMLDESKALFVGDSVLNNINRLSRPLLWDRNRRDELDRSLRRLRELDVETCMFGHGPPLLEETVQRVRALTDRPYDMPTWMIVLKNWKTLRRWQESTRKPGHWGATGK
ncbi:MAG: MBL fold metallo-hydrolase [Chloroflexi bacterium]|nr:MBL fold metallo-hydrolase [Chloroflexota bacterium]